jgi:hypothetical protein
MREIFPEAFSFSVGERKIMKHFVVINFDSNDTKHAKENGRPPKLNAVESDVAE